MDLAQEREELEYDSTEIPLGTAHCPTAQPKKSGLFCGRTDGCAPTRPLTCTVITFVLSKVFSYPTRRGPSSFVHQVFSGAPCGAEWHLLTIIPSFRDWPICISKAW